MGTIKERPILFSGAMVRALLNGSKTQTRRAIKPQPTQPRQAGYILHSTDKSREGGFQWSDADCKNLSEPIHCPYGQPGDRLWVRETLFWSACDDGWCYQADNDMLQCEYHLAPILLKDYKPAIPSIHMPRVASRLLLEITAVRVERLQDINTDDIKAEGIRHTIDYGPILYEEWQLLWEKINGPESWAANPWVWVVEFKVIDGKEVASA
ncbi:hypothetical protein FNT36_03130 [Hymenobacter setariae]|uniref:Morphogenetic protein n=1 Tax=Hymenobacter setariae TaxID=2594794 RepID=A0A558C2U6_9BACT|nr:hypothetical protein [Hymenobacter setariae]TVT43099.1 hypothetical protein FNT36_03130 [Hymenobacter setariae]